MSADDRETDGSGLPDTHQPERAAAAFLGGLLSATERESFSAHLLACPDCWQEVEQARRGRALVEAARSHPSPQLRDRVRAMVEAETLAGAGDRSRPSRVHGRRRHRLRGRTLAASAAALAVVLVLAVAGGTLRPRHEPAVWQAVADFSAQRLPGAQLPGLRAPDLSTVGLLPVGAGGGTYGALAVDGYAYRDPAGRRVVVYLSDDPFPEAPGARRTAGADGPWEAQRDGVMVLCARLPHALLVVGEDTALVRSAAGALGVL